MERSDKYTDVFHLMKMEELLNKVRPFLNWESNRSRAASERLLLQKALYWFGTGQYHSMGDMHGVSKDSVYTGCV
jgi:hypothetical protein